jgi:GrpB-like predicted nucleotidyltransferase (UPF0157 family)
MVVVGYIYRGDGGNQGGWLLVVESEKDFRTIHAHVVETTDEQWRYHYIGFRDLLRHDLATRVAHQRLKEENAAQFADDREAYTEAKVKFVRGIIAELEIEDRPK